MVNSRAQWWLFIILLSESIFAQTTGKIAGRVVDAESGMPLVAANVVLEETYLGAASDQNGNFYVINIPPGVYTVRIDVIGYDPVRVENIRVSVNRTSNIEVAMSPTVLEGQMVIIEVRKVAVKRDQTSTTKNVSSDEIEILPVENLGAVIAMQTGVVEGHFRGGRDTEVTYLIDGIQVDESFDARFSAVDLEPETVQDLEVITGTFNAEYGRAMSGVVNQVTKDGGNEFHGSVSAAAANYYTSNDNIFTGLKNMEFNRNQDYKFQLSGPIMKDYLTFFMNTRFQDNKNHLYGIRRFDVDNFSDFSGDTPSEWYSEHTGDSAYVPMNRSKNISFMGKLTLKPLRQLKLSTLYTLNNDEWHDYNHAFKYNPDGMAAAYRRTKLVSLQANHMLTNTLFYELKLSFMDNYSGWYVFEDPLSSSYKNDRYLESYGPGFFTGGQQKEHMRRTMKDLSAKFDITWQFNHNHSFKGGFLYTGHNLDYKNFSIRNKYYGTELQDVLYEPEVLPDSTIYSDVFMVKPLEFSAYLQDKMEFDDMVINLGVRYDHFDPQQDYPTDRRNPANQLDLPDSMMSTYVSANPKVQISPRLGLAYQLGEKAVLHFSYGHFFQIPPLYALYTNNSRRVAPSDYATTMSNPQVHPEKTVTYEIGLWQELMPGMGIEVALFYRDIYDLLSTKIISTYNQIEYGLYSNKDYGNVRGLEIKYDFARHYMSAYVNYTLQYTRGNADYPLQAFTRAGDTMDPVNRFIPMSWDQRHTLNVTLGYNRESYGITLTGYLNSGAPYTFSPLGESRLARINLYPNNDYRPLRYHADLTGYYSIGLSRNMKLTFALTVYNLLDRLNELWVNSQTGRAFTDVIEQWEVEGHRSNFNTYVDVIQNPSMYQAPRLVKFDVGLRF